MTTVYQSLLLICTLILVSASGAAQEKKDFVPQPGEFPPAGAGRYLSGELVYVDRVNRRGGLRLDGNPDNRYSRGPLHYFAMLPYGTIYHNGAPAELRDLPLGTHVHGYFVLPPEEEEETIPPLAEEQAKYEIPHNHAISLEDDFSYYQRRGQTWSVESLDLERGKIRVVPGGDLVEDGINKPYTFDIDDVTKVWKNRCLAGPEIIEPKTMVRFNLTWSPGWQDREFAVAEIWLDKESREYATELQRRRHVRFQRRRWVPGWIDSVQHNDFGGGTVTVTLFGGMAPDLYEDFRKQQNEGFGVACSDKTLRTWFHRADKQIGEVLQLTEKKDPPTGSSGISIRMKFEGLLDCYRPGNVVRVKCHDWLFVTMPPEERFNSLEEFRRAQRMKLP